MTTGDFGTVDICGIPVASVSHERLMALMAADCRRFRASPGVSPRTIMSLNAQAISIAGVNATYATVLKESDLVHADGQWLVWLSRALSRRPVPERTATTDMFLHAAERAAEEGYSFFLYGGTEDVNRDCAAELLRRYPALRIVGRLNGYDGGLEEAVDAINACRPDIVWVGLGKPLEQFMARDLKQRVKAAWIVTCGGCFHFMIGDYSRAPLWMQKSGLEWLHRSLTGPRRVAVRNLTTIPHAVMRVVNAHVLTPLKRRLTQAVRRAPSQ